MSVAPAKPTGSVDKALALAARGCKVFPVAVEWDGKARKWKKRPLTPRGFKDATTDATLIAGMWHSNCDAVVGVRHGDGIACLDIDSYKNPDAPGLTELLALLESLTLTHDIPHYKTASGGEHWIFRSLGGKRCKSIIESVEMLDGTGGFFIWWGDVP